MGYIYGLQYSSGEVSLSCGGCVTRIELQDAKLGLFEFFSLSSGGFVTVLLPNLEEGG